VFVVTVAVVVVVVVLDFHFCLPHQNHNELCCTDHNHIHIEVYRKVEGWEAAEGFLGRRINLENL
jgi:hypothetical protein